MSTIYFPRTMFKTSRIWKPVLKALFLILIEILNLTVKTENRKMDEI